MSKNVILVDYQVPENWDYHRAIEKETGTSWDIVTCNTHRYQGSKLKVICRYLRYFFFSFRMFTKRNRYEKVIAWQQFYGLLIAFYCRFFHVKKCPDIYIMTFIFKPKKNNTYNKFIRYIVASKYIKKLIVLSDSEKRYYSELFGISEDKFYCTRIGVPDVTETIAPDPESEKYYLSVGRSNRDYKFLRDAWKAEYGKLVIICDSYNEAEKEGIQCLDSCYGDDYLKMVANCYAEIIPLDDVNISSGSLSYLQAMMLSKPTIVTENKTVHDYIESGHNGIIIQKDSDELSDALKMLDDKDNYDSICRNARKVYEDNFSEYSLGVSISEILK